MPNNDTPPVTVAFDTSVKKPQSRSGERSVADYLLDQNRIGVFTYQLKGKPRYVRLKTPSMLDSLAIIYGSFFRIHWDKFTWVTDKTTFGTTKARNAWEYCARVYLTHWMIDLYSSIRACVKKLNMLAFNETYHYRLAFFSQEYDHFLSMLNASIRPTRIRDGMADETYIPTIEEKQDFSKETKFTWSEYSYDVDTFSSIIEVLKQRKICKMTPLSSDPNGRPSWLFDWPEETVAYAWFRQEGNYNEVDITVAYIVGVAISSKLGYCDIDEWKYVYPESVPADIVPGDYVRVVPRKWHGNADHRLIQKEEVNLPNYFEADKTKVAETNHGPLRLIKFDEASSTSSSTGATNMFRISSPQTSEASVTVETTKKAIRYRVHDFCYHANVICRMENETRIGAFMKVISL